VHRSSVIPFVATPSFICKLRRRELEKETRLVASYKLKAANAIYAFSLEGEGLVCEDFICDPLYKVWLGWKEKTSG
jgi:hypothetical protein